MKLDRNIATRILARIAPRQPESDGKTAGFRPQGPLLNPSPAERRRAEPNDLGGRCIILCSHGRTGSHWIMNSLNHHPDFFCTHTRFKYFDPATRSKVSAPEFDHLLDAVPNMTVDEYFDHIIRFRRSKHYLSSHNYQVNTVVQKLTRNPSRRRYVVVNITRHPVVRVISFVEKMAFESLTKKSERAYLAAQGVLENSGISSFARDLASKHGLALDDPRTMFFFASMWTIAVEADEMLEPVLHVPMERLVSDRQYFTWFTSRITENTSHFEPEQIETVFAQGRVNEVAGEGKRLPGEIYAGLPEWQRESWRRLSEWKDLPRRYDGMGYDFSFFAT